MTPPTDEQQEIASYSHMRLQLDSLRARLAEAEEHIYELICRLDYELDDLPRVRHVAVEAVKKASAFLARSESKEQTAGENPAPSVFVPAVGPQPGPALRGEYVDQKQNGGGR